MAKKLWNSIELIEAFSLYRRALEGEEELSLLEAPVSSRHIGDLVTGARALMRQKRTTDYTFSDGAVNQVAQKLSAYVDKFAQKHRLMFATVVALPDDDLRFERLYSTQLTVGELLKQRELEALRQEDDAHDFAPDEHRVTLANLESVSSSAYDFERRVNLLSPHSPFDGRGETQRFYPEARMEKSEAILQVLDYMTLGHLIEFDKR